MKSPFQICDFQTPVWILIYFSISPSVPQYTLYITVAN